MSEGEFVLETDIPVEGKPEVKEDPEKVDDSNAEVVPAKSDSVDEPEFNFLEEEKKIDPEPCQNFRLDAAASFGTCKCGHPKSKHGAKKENAAAAMVTRLKAKNSTVDQDDDDFKGIDGPCGKFRVDVAAKEFGSCKCGYKRAAHITVGKNNAEKALERLKSTSKLDEWRKQSIVDGPCQDFKTDTSAKEFGTCYCGYKKDEHKAKEQNAAALMLQNLKKKNKEKHEKEDLLAKGVVEEEIPEEPQDPVDTLTTQENAAEEPKTKKKKKDKKKGKNCVIC